MAIKSIHPATGKNVTRDVYRAITTPALIAEVRALDDLYGALYIAGSAARYLTDFDEVMDAVTDVLTGRVEAGDVLARAWYDEYDDYYSAEIGAGL